MNILHEMGQIYDKHCRFCTKPPLSKASSERMKWCESNCSYGTYYKKLSEHYLNRLEERRGKRLLTKEKYLTFKEDGKTDKKIMELTGTNHNKLNALKKEWGLIGKPGKPVDMSKAASIDDENFIHIDKYNHVKTQLEKANEEIKNLNEIVEQKNKASETVIGASEKLVEENKKLWSELQMLNEQLKQPAMNDDEKELLEQNHALRQCLKMLL